jgi:group II intron reverse transcriptase/maturase/CRISPR-associated endonuclease Cas1
MYYSLFDDSNIKEAWNKVKFKNTSGGIDGVSINSFEENLQQNLLEIKNSLKNNSYIPEPYERIYIKKENKKFRPIALLSLKDKIVQNAVYLFYSHKFEKMFVNSSYAYREGKGHLKAINRIKDYIARKMLYFCSIDIDNFFDSIDRTTLFQKTRVHFDNEYVQKLIEMWVLTGVVYNEKFIEQKKGIAQGGVISPLLSNLYLHQLDLELSNNNFVNVRYADNILLMGKTREEIEKALQFTKSFLDNNLSLKLNEPYKICSLDEGFTFCGINIKNNLFTIDKNKFDKLICNFKNIIERFNFKELIPKINNSLSGVARYYVPFDTKEQIRTIESTIFGELKNKISKNADNLKISEAKELIRCINFINQYTPEELNKTIAEIIDFSYKKDKPQVTDALKAVTQKKKQYQKVWFQNYSISVTTYQSNIGKQGDNLVVKNQGKVLKEINPEKAENIIVSAKGTTISFDAINLCAKHGVKINYVDEFGNPFAVIMPYVFNKYSIIGKQIESFENNKAKTIIVNIVTSKIKNQTNIIKAFSKSKQERKEMFSANIAKMEETVDTIKKLNFDIPLDSFREKVLGYEGQAAIYYWSMVKELIPKQYKFTEREHQHANNVVNVMLNYGYGILYGRLLIAIIASGLSPEIGFLHKEQREKPTLSYDLIEPFRAPIVDKTVIGMLNLGIKVSLNGKLLSDETKKNLLKRIVTKLDSEIKHNGVAIRYNDMFLDMCKNIVKFIQKDDFKFVPYVFKW